jgi:protein disulfide-isomerase A6
MIFLAAFALSELLNLTLENAAQIIGGPRPVFAHFSGTDYCPYCLPSLFPFSETSTLFPDILFADVNCPEQEDICEQFDVQHFPYCKLFQPRDRIGIDFDDEHITENYIYFLQNRTRFRALPSVYEKLTNLTESSWSQWASKLVCGVVLFHWERCTSCRSILPQLGLMADIFEADSWISIAAVSCERYAGFCRQLGVPEVNVQRNWRAVLRYFVNGTWNDWNGANMTRDLLGLINGKCGVERGLDGLLSDKAGTIPEADRIARAFAETGDKRLIEEMKAIEGSGFYQKMMERIETKGIEQLQKDAEALKRRLDARGGGKGALDEMKRRYNVIGKFIPTPTPLPRIRRKGRKKTPEPEVEL